MRPFVLLPLRPRPGWHQSDATCTVSIYISMIYSRDWDTGRPSSQVLSSQVVCFWGGGVLLQKPTLHTNKNVTTDKYGARNSRDTVQVQQLWYCHASNQSINKAIKTNRQCKEMWHSVRNFDTQKGQKHDLPLTVLYVLVQKNETKDRLIEPWLVNTLTVNYLVTRACLEA